MTSRNLDLMTSRNLDSSLSHVPTRTHLSAYATPPRDTLPDVLRTFVEETAASFGCDPAYVLVPALGLLFQAVGNTRVVKIKDDHREPFVFWGCLVAPSGTLKSPVLARVLSPVVAKEIAIYETFEQALALHELELERYKEELKKWRKDSGPFSEMPQKPDTPRLVRHVTEDTTVEALAELLSENPRGLLSTRDELAGWLHSFGRYGGGDGDLHRWCEFWNAGSLLLDRKTSHRRPTTIARAAVSVVGGIQPEVLRGFLRKHPAVLDSGLLARFLLVEPPPRAPSYSRHNVPREVSSRFYAAYERLLALDFYEGGPAPFDLPLSEDAREAFIRHWDRHQVEIERLMKSGAPNPLIAALSKLKGYAARLAGLHTLVSWAGSAPEEAQPSAIAVEAVEAAWKLVNWFKSEALRFYKKLGGGPAEARKLLETIEKTGGKVTPAELARSGPRSVRGDAEGAERLLNGLVREGHGTWHVVKNAKGGPAKREFHLIEVDTDLELLQSAGAGNGTVCANSSPSESAVETRPGQEPRSRQVSYPLAAADGRCLPSLDPIPGPESSTPVSRPEESPVTPKRPLSTVANDGASAAADPPSRTVDVDTGQSECAPVGPGGSQGQVPRAPRPEGTLRSWEALPPATDHSDAPTPTVPAGDAQSPPPTSVPPPRRDGASKSPPVERTVADEPSRRSAATTPTCPDVDPVAARLLREHEEALARFRTATATGDKAAKDQAAKDSMAATCALDNYRKALCLSQREALPSGNGSHPPGLEERAEHGAEEATDRDERRNAQ